MLITDKESLSRLKALNKLALSSAEDADTLAFFAQRNVDLSAMNTVDTDGAEPMVHIMPTPCTLREDKAIKRFERDELQSAAPKVYSGYLCVPHVLE